MLANLIPSSDHGRHSSAHESNHPPSVASPHDSKRADSTKSFDASSQSQSDSSFEQELANDAANLTTAKEQKPKNASAMDDSAVRDDSAIPLPETKTDGNPAQGDSNFSMLQSNNGTTNQPLMQDMTSDSIRLAESLVDVSDAESHQFGILSDPNRGQALSNSPLEDPVQLAANAIEMAKLELNQTSAATGSPQSDDSVQSPNVQVELPPNLELNHSAQAVTTELTEIPVTESFAENSQRTVLDSSESEAPSHSTLESNPARTPQSSVIDPQQSDQEWQPEGPAGNSQEATSLQPANSEAASAMGAAHGSPLKSDTGPSTTLDVETHGIPAGEAEANAEQNHSSDSTMDSEAETGAEMLKRANQEPTIPTAQGSTTRSSPAENQLVSTVLPPSSTVESSIPVAHSDFLVTETTTRLPQDSWTRQSVDQPYSATGRVVVQRVTDTLVHEISVRGKDGSKSISLQLHPSELGRLTVNLVWENETVKAQIIATELATSELLSRDKAQIMDTLQSNGLEFASFDVSYGGADQQQNDAETNDSSLRINPPEHETIESQVPIPIAGSPGSVVNIIA